MRAVESMEQTTTVVTITIKRAVTSIVRKETIWDGQHRLTILQSGQAMASSMNHHRIRSFFGHAFYEAASIRKINGRYYFIYSSENSNELCYATSQNYNGPYHFGGTIISNGDVGYHGRSGENRTNQTANDHGSLACIKGQWYIFHHRQTHSGTFSRQACAEPVRIAEDGSIVQVECTSMGFHRGALETKGSYPAIISCVLTNGAMPHITNTLIQEDIIFSARPKMWWVLLRLILSGAFVPYRH